MFHFYKCHILEKYNIERDQSFYEFKVNTLNTINIFSYANCRLFKCLMKLRNECEESYFAISKSSKKVKESHISLLSL